jgi:Spy/CpxP family protein refolding chaperone
MNRLTVLVSMGLGLLAATAWAQAPGAATAPARARAGMRGIPDVEQAVTLSDEQKAKVAQLQEQLRTKLREAMGERDEAAFEKMRELRQQLLEAARAGDDAKVEAVQKELDAIPMTAQRRKLVAEYYDEVAKLLTPEQKEPFEAWRKLQDSGLPANLLADPEALKAAIAKLEMPEAQKKEIDAAFAQCEAKVKELPAEDAAAKRAAQQALATQIVGLLKPSQKVLIAEAERPMRARRSGG